MNDKKPIEISAVKTDIGYFIQEKRDFPDHYNGRAGYTGLDHLLLDGKLGKELERSHNQQWVKVDKLPEKIEERTKQKDINYRYVLIDSTFYNAEKVPLVLDKSLVTKRDEDGDLVWIREYAHLRSLYKEISDPQPDLIVSIPFNIKIILEIDQVKEYGGFGYPVQRTRWTQDGFDLLTDKSVQHELVDTILFPDIILPARTSSLTSEQTYKVIRKHVQDNINPKYAKITSDYDFCFTVCKKIPLTEKVPFQKNVNAFSKRKAKYVTDYRVERSIGVFEMTHTGSNYKGYTPIAPFTGKNIEDLKENIDTFLADLMARINEPLVDCPHCKGLGVLLVDKAQK